MFKNNLERLHGFRLLQTKLYTPSPQPHIISRPRLNHKLKKGLGKKLTLISAPPGFGKTSLFSDWIHANGFPVAWFSIDSGDNNPLIFLNYMIAAFQKLNPEIGRAALRLIQLPQSPPLESILTSLINDIVVLSEDFVLVLDDYHLVQAQPIQQMLHFILEHQPKQMHLYIGTRSDPPLPLARLRSLHQLIEIRAADLSFNKEETTSLLNSILNLGLSPDEIDSVEAKVEGWAAGLQLLALSMQGRTDISSFIKAFQADHRYIADYLMEEVLSLQPKKVQDFLLQTSILDRFSASLCDAVTEMGDSQQMLNRLIKANLFIFPIDREGHWHRYHRLFADLLRLQLKAKDRDLPVRLHKRASVWHEENSMKEEAVEHALAAEDYKRSVRLIEEIVGNSWDRGRQAHFLDWFSHLPEDIYRTRLVLSIYRARALVMSGHLIEGEKILQELETAPDEKKKGIEGKLATIQALLAAYKGDIQSNILYSRKAVESLPEKDLMWRSVATTNLGFAYGWSGVGDMMAARQAFAHAKSVSQEAGNSYYEMFADLCLASVDGLQGRFQIARETFQRLLKFAESQGLNRSSLAGTILGSLGNIFIETGDFDLGMELINKGLEITEQGCDVAASSSNRLVLAYALLLKGDGSGTQTILQQIEADAQTHSIPHWMTHVVSAIQARIWLLSGKKEKVRRWIRERDLNLEENIFYHREIEYSVYARFLISEGRHEEADLLLLKMIGNAEKDTRITDTVQWRLLRVLNLVVKGDVKNATEELRETLCLSHPGGFVRIILSEGQPVAELLDRLYEEEKTGCPESTIWIPLPYLKKLRLAFKKMGPDKESRKEEKLSDRELEVLHLIAAGCKNQEIADKLYISLNTVRTHTKNINIKLDVHNRTQAVSKAKELGLLS